MLEYETVKVVMQSRTVYNVAHCTHAWKLLITFASTYSAPSYMISNVTLTCHSVIKMFSAHVSVHALVH